jgi:urate oxidase
MIELCENRYGKSRVRLIRVQRKAERHELRDWTVEILLDGDFESCFKDGDNSNILPTDTMKNTVYFLVHRSEASSVEEFAKELIDFLLGRNPQVSAGEVSIWEKPWENLATSGDSHPTTFVQATGERRTTKVRRAQGGSFSIASGIENLVLMKTAGSAFEGYMRDSLTTLAPAPDRLLGTALRARWSYSSPHHRFEQLRTRIRETLLSTFAAHESKSVQHTLYAMGEAVLKSVGEINDIELNMPNIHCLPVDLSRFGLENKNEVFVPVDEPHGYIKARLQRR